MSGQRAIKILHTADVHLGLFSSSTNALREGMREKLNAAFINTIDLALCEAVDLVLIVGDLFDANRVPEDTVHLAIEQLNRLDMPVVILPGNHDCLKPDGIYQRLEWERLCPGLKIIREPEGELFALPQQSLLVWGRPDFDQPGFRPLEGLPPRQPGYRWQVVMAHGHFIANGNESERSAPIREGEIAGCGWDYVALGHWPQCTEVASQPVPAWYSGAPFRQVPASQSGYALLASLESGEPLIRKIPVDV